MLSPKNSTRGKLLSQYVRVRITRMDDVDIALFERDWNNTLYYFVLNADEQIYMRYGGRDARDPRPIWISTVLKWRLTRTGAHISSMRTANCRNRAARSTVPSSDPTAGRAHVRPQSMCRVPSDRRFRTDYREQTGLLNKIVDLYRWPDIRTIGIELDVPQGSGCERSRGAVQAAGMKPGDRIAHSKATPSGPSAICNSISTKSHETLSICSRR